MELSVSQLNLLRQVIKGTRAFRPDGDSEEDLRLFQSIAEQLIELNEHGYFSGCTANRETRSGKNYIDLVFVQGVTAKGRRAVEQPALSSDNAGSIAAIDCPKCKYTLRPNAKFCDDCGYPLTTTLDSTLPMTTAIPVPTAGPTDSFVGQILHAKYQIISEIGKGGMGRVYRARRLGLGDDVAIKVIEKKFVSDATAVERFRREARAAVKLRHPNVVRIYDVDETPAPDHRPYIVMELIDGRTLKAVLQDDGRVSIERAVALMVEICRAIAAAHRQGVLHRDIKPDNIIVTQREGEEGESITVLDFGLAKMRESEADPSVTHLGTLMGTAFYMSPEQCRGEELDARSDVYSLAVVLFEMISGARPFDGKTVASVCAKHQSEPVPTLEASLGVPHEIINVLNSGLAKSPDERPADAQHFSNDLQKAYQRSLEVQSQAALAETVKDQKKDGPAEPFQIIPNLTRTDTLVLTVSCELALRTGHSDLIETSKILAALLQVGIAEADVWESLELLNERGYIKAHRVIGGGKPFQVYSIELFGFNEYATTLVADYDTIIELTIYAIVIDGKEDNFAIAEALNQPVLLINFILDLLENNRFITQSKRLGGKSVISKVTVELKRKAREIAEKQNKPGAGRARALFRGHE